MTDDKLDEITGDWDYRTLPENVIVGKGSWIERKESFQKFRSELKPGLIIGDRVLVYTWTTFNVEPTGRIELGDDSIIVGPVFMCAASIRIGRRVVVSYNVTIADSDFHPLDPELRKQDAEANAPYGDRQKRPPIIALPVVIEDDVHIGIGAILLKGVHIGTGATVGAGSVVTSDVPAHAHVAGNPAVVVRNNIR